MSISIHELLAVARESEGVKAVQGDAMLCEKRFAPDTRYMVEFLVLKQTEKFEEAGIYHRYFLTKKAYYEMIELQSQGIGYRGNALGTYSNCSNCLDVYFFFLASLYGKRPYSVLYAGIRSFFISCNASIIFL